MDLNNEFTTISLHTLKLLTDKIMTQKQLLKENLSTISKLKCDNTRLYKIIIEYIHQEIEYNENTIELLEK
jgi:hypothetical protein